MLHPLKGKRELRLVLISDTHEKHRSLRIRDGDVLIHAGDFTLFNRSVSSVVDFNKLLNELPHPCKIVVLGNHEFKFNQAKWRDLIASAVLLVNEGIEMYGIKFWGSPITPGGGIFDGSTAQGRRTCSLEFPAAPTY